MHRCCSRHLGLRQLWAGFDFALGRNREGNLPALARIGAELGYTVHVIEPVALGEKPVSSSQVRALLADGQVAAAADLLWRPLRVSKARSSTGMGAAAPSAFQPPTSRSGRSKILPRQRRVCLLGCLDGQRLPAVTNIGVRPTFEARSRPCRGWRPSCSISTRICTTRLLGLEFVEYLRPEERFASVEAWSTRSRRTSSAPRRY